jgi:phosphatidylserine/phosphatidylglycerophosphate/cardiolipin synthase-like enzyme
MVNFLKTNELSVEIENLISDTKDRLYLISPYFAMSPMLKRAIQRLDSTNAQIYVICRKEEKLTINPGDLEFLQQLRFKNILALEFLHAKCYMNERKAIVTSLNLLDISQQRNWEMGFIIDNEIDAPIFDKIKKYVDDILIESRPLQYELKKIEKEIPIKSDIKESQKKTIPGFCIHCGTQIVFSQKKPLCLKCYHQLGKEYNRESPERFCLACGKKSYQTFEKPICQTCEKKLSK